MMDTDTHYMRHALNVARTGLGQTGANPSVGCVIVKDGRVVAAVRTGDGGRPHAEDIALERAGDAVKGASVYVSLEPCAHEGETPSCARLLIESGAARVVIGCSDPDSRTAGQGAQMLRAAGVTVDEGVCADEAVAVHAGFFSRVTRGRPFVTLKCAMSLDGKIALGNGESQWITGDLARRYGHVERLQHDAIIVGVGTALADDPLLSVRLGGDASYKAIVVLDTHLRLSEDAKLVQQARHFPVHVFHACEDEGRIKALEVCGVRLHETGPRDLPLVLETLALARVNRVLVEGGAQVMTSFLRAGLYDRVLAFHAPKVIGDDGHGAIGALDITGMDDIYKLKRAELRLLGEDVLEVFEPCLQD